jgi:hypothetical protein
LFTPHAPSAIGKLNTKAIRVRRFTLKALILARSGRLIAASLAEMQSSRHVKAWSHVTSANDDADAPALRRIARGRAPRSGLTERASVKVAVAPFANLRIT